MGMRNEFNFRWANPVKIRSCKYLNNIVEQEHRRIKSQVQPMLGFKKFYNARRVLMGVELLQKLDGLARQRVAHDAGVWRVRNSVTRRIDSGRCVGPRQSF